MAKNRSHNKLVAKPRKLRTRNIHSEVIPGPSRGDDGITIDPTYIGSDFDDWLREEKLYDQLKNYGRSRSKDSGIVAQVIKQRESRHRSLVTREKQADRSLPLTAAARLLRVSRSHLLDLIERGQIAHHLAGARQRVMRSDCLQFKKRQGYLRSHAGKRLWDAVATVDSGQKGHVTSDSIHGERPHGMAATVTVPILRTHGDLKRALIRIDHIIDAPDGSDEAEERSILSLVVHEYESQHFAFPPTRHLNVLKYLMEVNNLSQADVPEIGPKSLVSAILAGKRRLNVRMISALARRFKLNRAAFLNHSHVPDA